MGIRCKAGHGKVEYIQVTRNYVARQGEIGKIARNKWPMFLFKYIILGSLAVVEAMPVEVVLLMWRVVITDSDVIVFTGKAK